MQVERVMIDELDCDPANVRAHDSENLDAIKSSLKRFGQQKPIVVNEKGIVIAGNGTLTAARALGWDSINIITTELDGVNATAYAIADNRTGELAEWDNEALAKQLSALQIEDEALVEAAGFRDAELTSLVDEVTGITEGNTDPDEVPEVPEEPTAQPGQIWQLGAHRLMCGDSTSTEDVAALMGGQKADMVFTDPPYGVDYEGPKSTMYFGKDKKGKSTRKILNDSNLNMYPPTFEVVKNFCSGPFYVFYGAGTESEFFSGLEKSGLTYISHLIWNKPKGSVAMGAHYKPTYESFIYGAIKNNRKWIGDNSQWTVLDYPRCSDGLHPTQKPVSLIAQILKNHDTTTTLDLFLGSGSTLITCEQLSRKCYGMELSPAYCDVIIKRWEDFTGQTAELVDG